VITGEGEAVLARMTPAERDAFGVLIRDAEAEGREWASDAMAMAIWAVAAARLRGYHVPPVVEPVEVMSSKCL
jgi:hypothetical protein